MAGCKRRRIDEESQYISKIESSRSWAPIKILKGANIDDLDLELRLGDPPKIYIPVHDGCNHWFLLVVNIKTLTVEIWDSLNDGKDQGELANEILRGLNDVLWDEMISHLPPGVWFTDFNITYPAKVPKQPNSFDCGLFVINLMRKPTQFISEINKFHSDEERMELVLYLITAEENKLKQAILKESEEHHESKMYAKDLCRGPKNVTNNIKANQKAKKVQYIKHRRKY